MRRTGLYNDSKKLEVGRFDNFDDDHAFDSDTALDVRIGQSIAIQVEEKVTEIEAVIVPLIGSYPTSLLDSP